MRIHTSLSHFIDNMLWRDFKCISILNIRHKFYFIIKNVTWRNLMAEITRSVIALEGKHFIKKVRDKQKMK